MNQLAHALMYSHPCRYGGACRLHYQLHYEMFHPGQQMEKDTFFLEDDVNPDETLCVACLDRPRDAVLLPCRHTVMCIHCAWELKGQNKPCPFCRSVIEQVIQE